PSLAPRRLAQVSRPRRNVVAPALACAPALGAGLPTSPECRPQVSSMSIKLMGGDLRSDGRAGSGDPAHSRVTPCGVRRLGQETAHSRVTCDAPHDFRPFSMWCGTKNALPWVGAWSDRTLQLRRFVMPATDSLDLRDLAILAELPT